MCIDDPQGMMWCMFSYRSSLPFFLPQAAEVVASIARRTDHPATTHELAAVHQWEENVRGRSDNLNTMVSGSGVTQ
jgi:hypothetical protein